jgi:hypothetical protein
VTLIHIAYQGAGSAIVITALTGFFGVIMRLALMDLAAKACPKYAEATAFAIFMSVFNLSAWGSNTLGAQAFEALKKTHDSNTAMAQLIIAGTLSVGLCWLLLPPLKQAMAQELKT